MNDHVRIKSQNIFYSQQDEQRRQISEKGRKNHIMCETGVRHSVWHCGKVEFVDEVTPDEQKLFGGILGRSSCSFSAAKLTGQRFVLQRK